MRMDRQTYDEAINRYLQFCERAPPPPPKKKALTQSGSRPAISWDVQTVHRSQIHTSTLGITVTYA